MLKNFKKLVSLVLVLVLSAMVCVPSFAAKKGLNDNTPSYVILTNNSTGDKFKVRATELIDPSGNSVQSNAMGSTHSKTYSFTINKNTIEPYSSSTTVTKDEWDDSLSVDAYLRLIYSETSQTGSGEEALLTNVNGRWDISDNSVSLSDMEIYYACVDPATINSQIALKYPTSTTFSYNTGFTHAVLEDGSSTACGAHTYAVLHHSSDSWVLEFSNTLFDNFDFPPLSNR